MLSSHWLTDQGSPDIWSLVEPCCLERDGGIDFSQQYLDL